MPPLRGFVNESHAVRGLAPPGYTLPPLRGWKFGRTIAA